MEIGVIVKQKCFEVFTSGFALRASHAGFLH